MNSFVITNNLFWCPDMCFDRILIDGAWHKPSCAAGAAWVGVDSKGIQLAQKQLSFFTHSAVVAEAQACLEALKWCLQSHIKAITILTDCYALITQLNDNSKAEWDIRHILLDIKLLCKYFDHVYISKVPRRHVQAAHKAAQAASVKGC
ncbi:hypothetical protein CsSME_00002164 [Camellia sinensis var. sinensis]